VNRKGFTLIELAVVLAIIAIVSGLVVVRLPGWSSRQALRASATALENAIKIWREKAQTEERTYELVLEERSYTTRFLPDGEVIRRTLGTDEHFERSDRVRFLFMPSGVLRETAITIRNSNGERITLWLRPLVNEVDYEDGK
jgi:prepilin-type N-terminal cleavage/methylation domain-containing protein